MANHLGAEEDETVEGARDPGVLGLSIYICIYNEFQPCIYICINIYNKLPWVQKYWGSIFIVVFISIFVIFLS